MGHKHSREQILEAALAAALDDGLSRLTFGRLAKRLGIHDRTVVYYFPTKDDLIREVLTSMGLEMQKRLLKAFRKPAADHVGLVRSAWPALANPAADSFFALFFEANGLAAAGREPYATLVPGLVEAWIVWATDFVEGTPARRRTEAETAIVLIDGLLLLRLLSGPAAAERVARRLGLR